MTLSDQQARDRFITEVGRNFSVLAPAGVGKTRAIVDRVVHMATDTERGKEQLAQLVVVTYTNKAADEMQQRARTALLEHPNGARFMGDFNRAFFGTIHSFCLNLLRTYGHYLGLPGDLEMANNQDEDALWVDFFRQFTLEELDTGLPPDHTATCFRHLRVQDVVELARHVAHGRPLGKLGDCPAPDFQSILDFVPDGRNRKTVDPAKERLRQWRETYESTAPFLPLPEIDRGGAEFQQVWHLAFAPLRAWLSHASAAIAGAVAADYEQYRIRRGQLTYADQIAFVMNLLERNDAGRQVRAQGYRIILDEAQDTDPNQFRVLLELARPAAATGTWADDGGVPPEPGRFCMVGDPQQSIYGKRADLAFYQNVRERLRKEGADELAFHVTFRCARRIIDAANALCPGMLNDADGQVSYVELKPKPGADIGQAVRWTIANTQQPDVAAGKLTVNEMAKIEAGQLAVWIKEEGLRRLGARDWSEVAILCARKRWIDPLELALRKHGLPLQNHSLRSVQIDDPAFAWFIALLVCVTEPCNSFEIVGVLREVFGQCDQDLYEFARAGQSFQIEADTQGNDIVAVTLRQLHLVRQQAMSLPILDAARHLTEATRLAERLAAISDDGGAAAQATLDALFSKAATAEAEGLSLSDWSQALKRQADDPLDPPPVRDDAIQLISCHAAKGLEWDTVILPFMGRPIATAAGEYPFVYENKRDRRSTMVFGRDWLDEDDTNRIKLGLKQEKQRLLYVAMTRARNCLVLVDDTPLFGWKKDSFAACLGVTEDKAPAPWTKLSSALQRAPEGAPRKEPEPKDADLRVAVTPAVVASAIARANRFPARILPYSLARHDFDAEPELSRSRDPEWESGSGETAKRYGTWWHGLMEKLDWKASDTWAASFDAALPFCPIPERAKREWVLFLQSDIARTLASPALRVQVEVPFVRTQSDGRCVEGFIDLVACDAERQEWIVLDWKTNEIEPERLKELWEIYEPQVAEYVITVRLAAGPEAQVRSCLYSSYCGKTVTAR